MDKVKRISELLDDWNSLFVHQTQEADPADGLCDCRSFALL